MYELEKIIVKFAIKIIIVQVRLYDNGHTSSQFSSPDNNNDKKTTETYIFLFFFFL